MAASLPTLHRDPSRIQHLVIVSTWRLCWIVVLPVLACEEATTTTAPAPPATVPKPVATTSVQINGLNVYFLDAWSSPTLRDRTETRVTNQGA